MALNIRLNRSVQVPLPEEGIIVLSKEPRYVFKVLRTYRNEKGQPTNDKVSIGRLDPLTGMLIPNNNYYSYYPESPVAEEESPVAEGKPANCMPRGGELPGMLALAYKTLGTPLARVRGALGELGLLSKKVRDLPAELVFIITLSLCLYRELPYEEVMRNIVEGLRVVFGDGIKYLIPTRGGISRARTRLGSEPFRKIYAEQVRPAGNPDKPGVMFCGLRVMALDGSTFDVPDEKANVEHFGYPKTARGSAGYPKLRFATLVECGTRILIGAQVGPYTVSENKLAKEVVKAVDSTMLVLTDRGLTGYPMWKAIGEQGSKRLGRVRNNQIFPVIRALPDGSFLSAICPDPKARRLVAKKKSVEGVEGAELVRIVEYTITGKKGKVTKFRLMTDLLDAKMASAEDLADLYLRRWEIETALDEFKVHLNGQTVLRSKKPELVYQEFYAMLIVHAALRKLMADAANTTELAPEELSFTGAYFCIRRRLPGAAYFPSQNCKSWMESLLGEISELKSIRSKGKSTKRGRKQKMSKYPLRKKGDPVNEINTNEIQFIKIMD